MKINIKKPNLTDYQKDFLYNDSRFTVTEASTKIGKTFAHIWGIYEKAHSPEMKEGQNVWWVAPVYSQTKIAFKRLKVKLAKTGIYKINESNLTITCPNGVIIHFKSAEKPDNLYGEDVYYIVFDEAPRARVEAYYALRSTITATGGKMKLIGNFGGSANWMHQLKEKAKTDKEYAYFKITAWDGVEAGILSREEIEQAQRDLPPKIFKSLYLAEEQENEDMLISYGSINDLFTNNHVKDGTMYITADIALHGSDTFVLFVWSGFKVVHCKIIDKCDADEVEKVIKDTAEKWKVGRSNIAYDADGLGSFLRGYLKGAIPFNNGSSPIGGTNYKNLKSQCIYKMAELVEAKEVFIDCEIPRTTFIQELECMQSYDLDKEGKIQALPKIKIKELIGRSPDLLDAFIIRARFELKNKSIKFGRSGTINNY